jgi:hypothetical protein
VPGRTSSTGVVMLLFVQISPGNNIPLQYGFYNQVMQAIAD